MYRYRLLSSLHETLSFVGNTTKFSLDRTNVVYMCPGESELTRIFFVPSSQAMLRAIWRTADLLELYDTHAWS